MYKVCTLRQGVQCCYVETHMQAWTEPWAYRDSYSLQVLSCDTSLLQRLTDTAVHSSLMSFHSKHWYNTAIGCMHISLHTRWR